MEKYVVLSAELLVAISPHKIIALTIVQVGLSRPAILLFVLLPLHAEGNVHVSLLDPEIQRLLRPSVLDRAGPPD